MTRKTVLAATLILASTATTYAGCRAHTGPVLSCASGTLYDADSRSCVSIVSS